MSPDFVRSPPQPSRRLPDHIFSPPRKRPPIIFHMGCRNIDLPGVLAAKRGLLNTPPVFSPESILWVDPFSAPPG
jgi:hypothetical protein